MDCTHALLIVATAAVMLLAGCGGPQSIARKTPEATGEAFIEAMKAGDYDMVARGFEYETQAREKNPDWDTFGQSQRNLIIGKLQERKAEGLSSLSGMFAAGEASAEKVRQEGDSATVTVTAGANTLTLQMTQVESEWLIADLQEQAG